MAASFGIHVGNTSVCLAVSRDGKTDVVAAPTGDRVTPAIVAFTDTEVVVGLAAKQGRLRNMANTVTDNKRMLVGGGGEEGLAPDTAVNIIEENGQHFYCVDFKDQETRISPTPNFLRVKYKNFFDLLNPSQMHLFLFLLQPKMNKRIDNNKNTYIITFLKNMYITRAFFNQIIPKYS